MFKNIQVLNKDDLREQQTLPYSWAPKVKYHWSYYRLLSISEFNLLICLFTYFVPLTTKI